MDITAQFPIFGLVWPSQTSLLCTILKVGKICGRLWKHGKCLVIPLGYGGYTRYCIMQKVVHIK